MTDVENLPAGRALDALVAEKVMGLTHYEHGLYGDDTCAKCDFTWDAHRGGPGTDCPIPNHYSTDIAAAWDVVEKFHATLGFVDVGIAWSGQWYARFDRYEHGNCPGYDQADTAPLAICRAAIKAVTPTKETTWDLSLK